MEAPLRDTGDGLLPDGDGWFVLNTREAQWRAAEGRSAVVDFEGDVEFPHVGVNISVLQPGQSLGMYHWEVDQEDFLVLAGEALLIVEGEERPLRAWDFVHCPPRVEHIVVGAGDGPCVVLAIGARIGSRGAERGGYTVNEVALRHGVGVETATTESDEAYAGLPRRTPTRYRDGWLPGP